MNIELNIVPNQIFFLDLVLLIPILSLVWFFFIKPYSAIFFERMNRLRKRETLALKAHNEFLDLEDQYTESFVKGTRSLDQTTKIELLSLQKRIQKDKQAILKEQKTDLQDFSKITKEKLAQEFKKKQQSIKQVAEQLLPLCLLVGVPETAQASQSVEIFWSFFQFSLFVGAIRLFGWKALSSLFEKARASILQKLQDAQKSLIEKQSALAEMQTKHKLLENTLTQIKNQHQDKKKKWREIYNEDLKNFSEEIKNRESFLKKHVFEDIREEYDHQLKTLFLDELETRAQKEDYRKTFHERSIHILLNTPPSLRDSIHG
jgi:F0F1-type ATP synthase membrane subunit b/b'